MNGKVNKMDSQLKRYYDGLDDFLDKLLKKHQKEGNWKALKDFKSEIESEIKGSFKSWEIEALINHLETEGYLDKENFSLTIKGIDFILFGGYEKKNKDDLENKRQEKQLNDNISSTNKNQRITNRLTLLIIGFGLFIAIMDFCQKGSDSHNTPQQQQQQVLICPQKCSGEHPQFEKSYQDSLLRKIH